MQYIIISMLTIFLFTYVVYIVANKLLSIQIHIKYIFLCACCALIISIILPRLFVGFAGLTGTLSIVFLFALVSSYGIAYYYDHAMQQAPLKNDVMAATVENASLFPVDSSEIFSIISHPNTSSEIDNLEYVTEDLAEAEDINEDVSEIIDFIDEPIIDEPIIKEYLYPIKIKKHDIVLLSSKKKDQIEQNIIKNVLAKLDKKTNSITESITKKYYYPIKYQNVTILEKPEINNPTLKPDDSGNIVLKTDEKVEVLDNLMKHIIEEKLPDISFLPTMLLQPTKASEDPVVLEQHVATEIVTTYVSSEQLSDLPEQQEPAITLEDDSISGDAKEEITTDDMDLSTKDLDTLMDYAFALKEQRDFLQALKVFRQALLLYPSSEVGPFLVMEIGNILKNIGSYNEAITIFTEGRLLPGVINNDMLEQEFINNIAYLRIVKNILIKNSLKFMPFNQLPENVYKEINAEFCEWRNQL